MLISKTYVSLSLILPVKGYKPEKIFLIFEKRGKQPPKSKVILMKIPLSENSIVSSSYLRKCGILYFLPEERSLVHVYLFFPTG